jgi:hypothetical protein
MSLLLATPRAKTPVARIGRPSDSRAAPSVSVRPPPGGARGTRDKRRPRRRQADYRMAARHECNSADVVKTAAGKTEVVAEHDLSGGITALLNLLRSEAPIPRRVRDALVFALDPRGGFALAAEKAGEARAGPTIRR